MLLKVRFDAKNDLEIFNEKILPLATNFINFISLDIENILNDEIISNLSENNYKEIISKIVTASDGSILKELIDIDDISNQNNIRLIKKDLGLILDTYTRFKQLTEFCYFNENVENMTLLQRYLYYLHKFNVGKVTLPKQTISSFDLKIKSPNAELLKNDNDIILMLQENSPYFYITYECLNISEYMTASFLQLIENNYLILKCKNCNKYFIAYKRTDTYYCDRQSPQDTTKTCKQYGADKAWWIRTKDENDWYNLYRKVYQSFQMKAKRNPNNPQLKKNFDNFRADANKWKKAIKDGTKTEAEFMYWLQEFRK